MAKKTNYVWGLEIGQSALKALRCYLDGDQMVTDMFDFVEYPKILSQPEAEPEKLVADAIQQFISRNDLRGAKVAISPMTGVMTWRLSGGKMENVVAKTVGIMAPPTKP